MSILLLSLSFLWIVSGNMGSKSAKSVRIGVDVGELYSLSELETSIDPLERRNKHRRSRNRAFSAIHPISRRTCAP